MYIDVREIYRYEIVSAIMVVLSPAASQFSVFFLGAFEIELCIGNVTQHDRLCED